MTCLSSSPNHSLCSNHGSCVSDQCICFPKWTSLGDFSFKEFVDCNIYLPAVEICGLVIFVFELLSSLYFIWVITLRMKRGIPLTHGLILFPFFLLMEAVGVAAFGFLKYKSSTRFLLGESIEATFLIGWASFFMASATFQLANILKNFVKGHVQFMPIATREVLNLAFSVIHRARLPFHLFAFLVTFAPMLGAAIGVNSFYFASIYFAGNGVVYSILVAIMLRLLSIILTEVSSLIDRMSPEFEKSKLSSVHMKLAMIDTALKVNCVPLVFVLMSFAFSLSIQRQSTYFFLAQFIGGGVVALLAIFLLTPQNAGSVNPSRKLDPNFRFFHRSRPGAFSGSIACENVAASPAIVTTVTTTTQSLEMARVLLFSAISEIVSERVDDDFLDVGDEEQEEVVSVASAIVEEEEGELEEEEGEEEGEWEELEENEKTCAA
jgi:hypothetical protein